VLDIIRQAIDRPEVIFGYLFGSRAEGRALAWSDNALCSAQGLRRPTSYQDALTVLEERNVRPGTLVNKLKPLIRLRNQLVHIYWDIDPKRGYRATTKQLGSFEECSEQVTDYLDRTAPPKQGQ
jgi:uncharacterized protein YutE (UPF0331/DUF86 family)